MQEIWKDIPGYIGSYQVSNLGRVKSLPRIITYESNVFNQHMDKPIRMSRQMTIKGKIKKLTLGNHGYFVVNLGNKNVHTVHKLVANTFLVKKNPNFNHIDHINRIRTDNRVENLEWVTQQENNSRQRFLRGEERYNARLSKEKVIQIRKIFSEADQRCGILKKLAETFNVSTACIYDVIHRKTWKHV